RCEVPVLLKQRKEPMGRVKSSFLCVVACRRKECKQVVRKRDPIFLTIVQGGCFDPAKTSGRR
ncbi:hypothetical protein, partial [Caballeronia terrestris]|uniref:hypothetical protein n=1 Tax=Caballeronia terrestris TaxID=1226301 RepID=UPI001F3481F1